MPTVEEAYHQYWGKVGGVGRLRRTFSPSSNEILGEASEGGPQPRHS